MTNISISPTVFQHPQRLKKGVSSWLVNAPTLQTPRFQVSAKFSDFSIVVYNQAPKKGREKSESELANLEKGRKGLYNGYLSPTTANKIKGFLSAWLSSLRYSQKSKIRGLVPTFVTLTLPSNQKHTDNELKRLALMPFIENLKKRKGVQFYFWRAEMQKNNSIHFHMIFDKAIPHQEIRRLWNLRLEKLGYINDYRKNQQAWHNDGFRLREDLTSHWSEESQKKAYDKGVAENWSNPNSTDIHRIGKTKSICSYVVKYCTKTDKNMQKISYLKGEMSEMGEKQKAQAQKQIEFLKSQLPRKVEGRIWGCSDELRNLRTFTADLSIDDCENHELSEFLWQVQNEVKAENVVRKDNFTVIKLVKPVHYYLKKLQPDGYGKHYQNYHEKVYDLLYEFKGIAPDLPPDIPEVIEEELNYYQSEIEFGKNW